MIRAFVIIVLFLSNILLLYSQKIKPAFKEIIDLREIHYYPEPIVVISCKDVENKFGIDLFGSAEANNNIYSKLYEIGKINSLKKDKDTSDINRNLNNNFLIINELKKYAGKDSAINSHLLLSMIDTFPEKYICFIVHEAFYRRNKTIYPDNVGKVIAVNILANSAIAIASGGFFVIAIPKNSHNTLSQMHFYLIEKSSRKVIYTICDVQKNGLKDVPLPFLKTNTDQHLISLIFTLQDAVDMNIKRYKRKLKKNKE